MIRLLAQGQKNLPCNSFFPIFEGEYDVVDYGLPYAIRIGPYGYPVVLTWDRDNRGISHILALAIEISDGVQAAFELQDVDFPHDLEIVPAPLESSGIGDRLISVLVAETSTSGKGGIKKFVITPSGHIDNHSVPVEDFTNDTRPEGEAASHHALTALKPVKGASMITNSSKVTEREEPGTKGNARTTHGNAEEIMEGERKSHNYLPKEGSSSYYLTKNIVNLPSRVKEVIWNRSILIFVAIGALFAMIVLWWSGPRL